MKSLLNLMKCTKCGLCCLIQVKLTVEGKQFIPMSFTLEDIDDGQKKYLALQVCESFNQKTRKCADYENRPPSCRSFDCKGSPTPQTLNIVGRPTEIIQPLNRRLRRIK